MAGGVIGPTGLLLHDADSVIVRNAVAVAVGLSYAVAVL